MFVDGQVIWAKLTSTEAQQSRSSLKKSTEALLGHAVRPQSYTFCFLQISALEVLPYHPVLRQRSQLIREHGCF